VKYTDEQNSIIRATPELDCPLVVSAFAGTGKTATLEGYALFRPKDRMLYAAYNKAIQQEAEARMPHNVTARTTHSLAFRAYGCEYANRDMLSGNIPLWMIAKHLKSTIILANFAFETLKVFLASKDVDITPDHIPDSVVNFFYKDEKPVPALDEMATKIWESMQSLEEGTLPMVHDGYLKLYQLSGPVLNYDYILLDEAQDTTPCVWDIVSNQNCRKVLVGDPYQAIYGWRGAIDAFGLIEKSEPYYLTQSFRFGPEVAALASTLLSRHMGEDRPLRGYEELDTEILTSVPTEDRTILARGNASIFKNTVHMLGKQDKMLGYVGGTYKNYPFQVYLDTYYLLSGQKGRIKNPLIKNFPSINHMMAYAEKVESRDLQSACMIAKEYDSRVESTWNALSTRSTMTSEANICFSTGHKAKGLEFPIVEISDDFDSSIASNLEEKCEVPTQELNLLYVVITRGSRRLYIPHDLKYWIEHGSGNGFGNGALDNMLRMK
jgi:hypothetical protein